MSHDWTSTRARLLTAAERLYLERGVNQVSVRAINAEAGLIPGAVQHHFGSREGLVGALLECDLFPLWRDRLEGVAEQSPTDTSGNTPLDVRSLVAAVVEPFDDLVRSERGRMLCRPLAQTCLSADRPLVGSPWFGTAPFEMILGRVLPHLSVHEMADRWRLAFAMFWGYTDVRWSRAMPSPPNQPSTKHGPSSRS
ncbi:TetR/AcrR family transcriptional regulator [Streptomyces sp. NPDC055681]